MYPFWLRAFVTVFQNVFTTSLEEFQLIWIWHISQAPSELMIFDKGPWCSINHTDLMVFRYGPWSSLNHIHFLWDFKTGLCAGQWITFTFKIVASSIGRQNDGSEPAFTADCFSFSFKFFSYYSFFMNGSNLSKISGLIEASSQHYAAVIIFFSKRRRRSLD